MTKKFRKTVSIAVSAALALSSLQFAAAAEETGVFVDFIGVNATLTEGTYGESAASVGEDYTTTVTVPDGYEITYFDCFGEVGASEYNLPYDYDEETGALTVPGESIMPGNIVIWVFASRDYNEETDLFAIDTIPYEETLTIGAENAITEIEYCAVLYSLSLKANETVLISFYGTETTDTDTQLFFCEFSEYGELLVYDGSDIDSTGNGELYMYTAVEDEVFYFAASVYDTSIDEEVMLKVEYVDPDEYGTSLDFTDAVPEPEDGDLWEWDSASQTLTLFDGFDLVNIISNGITLPEGSTIIVEGKASVNSNGEAIECFGGLSIELQEGAELILNSSNADAIEIDTDDLSITGTPDAEGNLPKIVISYAEDDGINVVDGGDIIIDSCVIDATLDSEAVKTTNGSVYITDSRLNIVTESSGITSANGEIVIESSEVNIKSNEAGIYTAAPVQVVYSADETDYSHIISITDSIVEVYADILGIAAVEDGIVITDSEVAAIAETGLYIEDEGGIEVTGGRLEIVADKGIISVPNGDFTLDNTAIAFYSRGDETAQYYFGNGVIFASGIIEATDGENTYIGEWSEEIVNEEGALVFTAEDGTEFFPLMIMSYFEGTTEDNVVDGIESEYTQGDEISFTTSTTDPEPEYPINGNTRYYALRWNIEGTELSGWIENNEGVIDTSGLEPGEYTLNVIFAKQSYSSHGGWGAIYSDPETAITDTVSVSFTVVADESEDGGEDITPDEGEGMLPDIDSGTDKDDTSDNPETGVDFGSAVAMMVISGAVIIASRRKNK